MKDNSSLNSGARFISTGIEKSHVSQSSQIMPPKQRKKRAAKTSFCKKPEKVPRLLNNKKSTNIKVEIKKTQANKIQELEHALEQKEGNSRVLQRTREVAETPNLSLELRKRLFTLLMFCARVDGEYIVRQLLDKLTINLKTPDGGEVLWTAIRKGHEGIVELLVRAGVDLSIRDKGRTPLHAVMSSCKNKNSAKREQLVRTMINHGADVNARDAKRRSVLYEAIFHKHFSSQLVEEMLDLGAEVTISESNDTNDLSAAARSYEKIELLPKLIVHRVTDDETRNNRAMIAIQYLLDNEYVTLSQEQTAQMIKKILDLGVPVSSPHPYPKKLRSRSSVLHEALWCKKRNAIKQLLDYGADPHEKNGHGHTTLFQAALKFKSCTDASRWLIERGVSIHDRNADGCYPIHGACFSNSLGNIHLFLNLGADLNVSDVKGRTPFSCTNDLFNFNEAHCLIIKHFALIISQGGSINIGDKEAVESNIQANHYFKMCTNELKKMKVEKICGNVTYFSLFSKDIRSTMQFFKNSNFDKSFKLGKKKRLTLFPIYSNMLFDAFKIAEKRYETLQASKEKLINKTFVLSTPDQVLENIAYYSCSEKFERCRYDYYMTLHKNFKFAKADKKKFL